MMREHLVVGEQLPAENRIRERGPVERVLSQGVAQLAAADLAAAGNAEALAAQRLRRETGTAR